MELLRQQALGWLRIELSRSQLALFQLYYEVLVDWNSRTNLTAITEYQAVQSRHFLDSLALAAPFLRGDSPSQSLNLDQARLIDIGAGAGFPGLPLKIVYPGLKLTLVDSVGKKTAFLSRLAGQLGFEDVEVINGRAEDLGRSAGHREQYDLATGRAVAAWPVLAEYCLPFCRVGGLFVAPKKGDLSAELAAAPSVAATLGARLRSTPEYFLPGEAQEPANRRRLVVAQKYRPTPQKYPRRTGLPAQQPLDATPQNKSHN